MRTRAVGATITSTLIAALLLLPTAAEARGGVSVRNDQGKAEADSTYSTTVTVSGSGFQSIKNAHGGIYVAFGTVSGTWRPSQGGVTGAEYRYVPDSEAKGNKGFLRYVAFPGSDTASSANGGTLKDGSFSTKLTIPGPTFQTYDRNNKVTTVDCLKVQCGVITFGAHGVKNANNESFTPVKFTKLVSGDVAPSAGGGTATAPDGETGEPTTDEPAAKPAKKVKAAITVDQRTAVQGRVLAFTAVGFTPGEQVLAILDDGVAAAGPITVGTAGEVAAVIQVPATTEAGTHTLRLSAPSSGTEVERNFPIAASKTAVTVAETTDEGTPDWLPWVAAGAAAILLLLSIAFAIVRTRRLRSTSGVSHAS